LKKSNAQAHQSINIISWSKEANAKRNITVAAKILPHKKFFTHAISRSSPPAILVYINQQMI